jgi:uncharacterized lipoprotein YddW (UPF0748 family)
MNDYFYPYPTRGNLFPRRQLFQNVRSFSGFFLLLSVATGAVINVNLLIQQIKLTIAGTKPWVRFWFSPFGIYRNKRNDPNGSDTNGLQNYDDLYADIKLWVEKGWIDYNLPQLFGRSALVQPIYTTLLHWWNAI